MKFVYTLSFTKYSTVYTKWVVLEMYNNDNVKQCRVAVAWLMY